MSIVVFIVWVMLVCVVVMGFWVIVIFIGVLIIVVIVVLVILVKIGVGIGMKVVIILLCVGVKVFFGELFCEIFGWNCWCGECCVWIEVCGLCSGGDDEFGCVVFNVI